MVKPIGNLVANLRSDDKVGFKTREKFSAKTTQPGTKPTSPAANSSKKPAKYKQRKK